MTCDPDLLNRFFDKELGPDESARVAHHLKYCRTCQASLRDSQSVSALLRTSLEEAVAHINFEELEQGVVALIQSKRRPWWMKLRDQFVSKKFYVPAAAIATGLVRLARVPSSPLCRGMLALS
jgi:anti-sigma factor RsiW